MKLRGLVPNFYINLSVGDLFIPKDRSAYYAALPLRTDRGIISNRSQKHECNECRNWDRGRAVSFLGIFVSSFRYNAFAVFEIMRRALSFLGIFVSNFGAVHAIMRLCLPKEGSERRFLLASFTICSWNRDNQSPYF
jgi:hypothetical protein